MDIDIIYCDNHLLAAAKPAGLLTQPSGTDRDSLEERGKAWVKTTYAKPGNVYLEAVHRLDRQVSGVVLFARTSKATSRLNASLRERAAGKIYLAVVEGRFDRPAGTLTDYLAHGSHRAVLGTPDDAAARKSVLRFRVLAEADGLSLVRVELITGRYHQIRAQLAHAGHPVVADRKYGARTPVPGTDAIALHHRQLTVAHPVGQDPIALAAPVPDGWPWRNFPGADDGVGTTTAGSVRRRTGEA